MNLFDVVREVRRLNVCGARLVVTCARCGPPTAVTRAAA